MKPSLKRTERPDAGVRRVIREAVDRRLERGTDSSIEEHVHGLRTVIKRTRAHLRLVRGNIDESWYRRTDSDLRDAARQLASTRDRAVLLETADRLASGSNAAELSDALTSLRRALLASDPDHHIWTAVRCAEDTLRTVAGSFDALQLDAGDWPLFESGLRRTHRRARRSMRTWLRSNLVEDAHRWRRHVKYLMFQVQLLQKMWPARLPALRKRLGRLAECLGRVHDLAVLEMAATRAAADAKMSGDQAKIVVDESGRSRRSNIRRAKKLGQKIFEERPRKFANAIGRRWRGWRRCKGAGPCHV